jgi:DNA-binding transcriptional regulator YhcF (GntR family)
MAESTAEQRAREHVLAVVEACRRTGSARLPPIRRLAGQTGLSATVTWRAVTSLRREGVLLTRRGGWIEIAGVRRAGDEARPAQDAAARGPKWARLSRSIAEEILHGRIAAGSVLPGPKELAERHGVSYRTLRKAVDALVQSGVLTAYRRGFRVPFAGGGLEHNGSLVVIARGSPDAGPVAVGPRTVEIFHLLENECARARVALEFVPYDYVNGRVHPTPRSRALLAGRSAAGQPLGFVVFCNVQNPDSALPDNLLSLAPLLTPFNAPIVLLSETGEREQAVADRLGRRLTVVSMANSPLAGARMAERLLGLGHRRVAFISAHHNGEWSRNRYAGLAAAFTSSCHDASVAVLARADVLDAAHLRPQRDRTAADLDQLHETCRRTGTLSMQRLDRALATRAEQLGAAVECEAVREALQPLMRDALKLAGVTAWVGANDDVAVACMEYLRAQGRRIPQDVSVVGFDDSADAQSRRLTSYNFDCAGAVHAALHHALQPRLRRPAGGKATRVDIEGYLVERATLAVAPLTGSPS